MNKNKFRCWDTDKKQFINCDNYWVNLAFDKCMVFGEDVGDETVYKLDNTLVFQQSTGLHDVNSTCIYEGDLVKYSYGTLLEMFNINNTLSKYYCAQIYYINGEYCLCQERIGRKSISAWIICDNECALEVFGNIYENPPKTTKPVSNLV